MQPPSSLSSEPSRSLSAPSEQVSVYTACSGVLAALCGSEPRASSSPSAKPSLSLSASPQASSGTHGVGSTQVSTGAQAGGGAPPPSPAPAGRGNPGRAPPP